MEQEQTRDFDQYFKNTIKLLEEHQYRNHAIYTNIQNNLLLESLRKLKQIEFLIKKIVFAENKLRSLVDLELPIMLNISRPIDMKSYKKQKKLEDQIEIYAESFYYFSFRLRCLIRNLPKLKSFEVENIRNIRNHLIEHSEKPKSLITSISFGHIGPFGPTVKPARTKNESSKFIDKGLYFNLKELKSNLDSAIQNSK